VADGLILARYLVSGFFRISVGCFTAFSVIASYAKFVTYASVEEARET